LVIWLSPVCDSSAQARYLRTAAFRGFVVLDAEGVQMGAQCGALGVIGEYVGVKLELTLRG